MFHFMMAAGGCLPPPPISGKLSLRHWLKLCRLNLGGHCEGIRDNENRRLISVSVTLKPRRAAINSSIIPKLRMRIASPTSLHELSGEASTNTVDPVFQHSVTPSPRSEDKDDDDAVDSVRLTPELVPPPAEARQAQEYRLRLKQLPSTSR
jgi:hypothetical protein